MRSLSLRGTGEALPKKICGAALYVFGCFFVLVKQPLEGHLGRVYNLGGCCLNILEMPGLAGWSQHRLWLMDGAELLV